MTSRSRLVLALALIAGLTAACSSPTAPATSKSPTAKQQTPSNGPAKNGFITTGG